jgi:phospholipase C
MHFKNFASNASKTVRLGLATVALFQFTVGASLAGAVPQHGPSNGGNTGGNTTSPIKHVIVIIGENRSFDHVFATYVPKPGETVNNLLSEGIIKLDANKNAVRGPNFDKAHQLAAADNGPADTFLLDPPKTEFPNNQLPAPLTGGPNVSYVPNLCAAPTPITQCMASLNLAQTAENGLDPAYYPDLLNGGTGLAGHIPDTRITNVNTLPAGPFQLTNGSSFNYHAYAASPVHRFYQMWQQENCSVEHASWENPSGCNAKLFSWVEVTVGAGANGVTQPPLCSSTALPPDCFSTEYVAGAVTTGEGSTALGFYNVQQGDAPYFKTLADNFAMSDNFHQSVDGGTGANHIMLGHGDAIWFYDPNSATPYTPPENAEVDMGTDNSGVVSEVENPDPAIGTNNWYTQDGYGNGGYGSHSSGGGSYSNCADPTQPGVKEIVKYLSKLPRPIDPRCEEGHYYLLNNYNPGWFPDSTNAYIDTTDGNTPFTIPPSSTRSIGDELNDHKISWKYYGDQWNAYQGDKYQNNYYVASGVVTDEYCNICNPFQYDTSIMSNPAQVAAHIQDTANLYADIANNQLPAVSFVKPSGLVDGHPASSKLELFEGFAKKIVDAVRNSDSWKDTAIFITFDEGGGYYDSGYVQPVDFFGDGTRIPLMVVSPFTKPGHISHKYADHVSILKFIERNWSLPPVTKRSRDNFPNPLSLDFISPYVPLNSPALDDLFDLFDFDGHGGFGH